MKARSIILVLCMVLIAAPAIFAEDGATLYRAKCAMCHGASGQGDTPMGKTLKVKNLSSPDVQKQTDEQLTSTINKGKGKMPPFAGKLSEDQVKAVIGYVRTLGK
jgi:cytochrome c6